MDEKHFLNACELINSNLVGFDVNRAFNSVGSHVFFEFGKERMIVSENGRESIKKEWIIWIGRASWRITKNGKYEVGSDDSRETINLIIQKFLGKRFQSLCFLSSFLDIQLAFNDGYQITTFFSCSVEDQWTIFLPDQTIGIDCASPKEIKDVQKLAEDFSIIENYKKLDIPLLDSVIVNITYDELQELTFHFENEFSINFIRCDWRLEKNNDYLIGYGDCYLDDEHNKIKKLYELIGKKIRQIDVMSFMVDARFQFEDQYVLKTFGCSEMSQWSLSKSGQPIFEAKIVQADV